MYGLPADEDFRFLIGLVFSSFNLSRHQVILTFSDPRTPGASTVINVQGRLGVQLPAQNENKYDDLPRAAQDLPELLDEKIVEIAIERAGTLSFRLSGQSVIRLYDSFDQYESYQIHHGDDVFVV